jgi:uncharacterized protein YyaL (SSP411 family)
MINTLLKLKANGLTDATLKSVSCTLTQLNKLSHLTNPEQAKLAIANLKVANSCKDAMRARERFPGITDLARFTKDLRNDKGKATAFVCRNHVCNPPTTNVHAILELLDKQ